MSLKPTRLGPIVGIHIQDINWIIALWFAIHGGDPAPEHLTPSQAQRAAAELIRAAAVHLPPEQAKAVANALGS